MLTSIFEIGQDRRQECLTLMLEAALSKEKGCLQFNAVPSPVGTLLGAWDSVVVKALCYKPKGRGFDTR
jgi:hypothetical protein